MKKIILLTYEFTYSPFSGNGILARSLVKSFLGLGCTVTVWCCRPSDGNAKGGVVAGNKGSASDNTTSSSSSSSSSSSDNHLAPPEISEKSLRRLELLSSAVPRNGWRRVDDLSCWRDFNISNLLLSDVVRDQTVQLNAAIFDADVVCVIDWTGAVAYRSIVDHGKYHQGDDNVNCYTDITKKLHLYLNFRVFSSGVDDDKRRDWYDQMDYQAMKNANVVVSLSSKDTQQLSAILLESKDKRILDIPMEIAFPPLRQDMEDFAKFRCTSNGYLRYLPEFIQSGILRTVSKNYSHYATSATNTLLSKRPLIVCVARQSPEKCVHRFVEFAEMAANILQELNLMVVLAGAPSDVEYAKQSRKRLLRAVPQAIIIDRFLSPTELGALFAHTLINFHPASYDAYGMTIVEAAAFGAPSVLAGPSIGAFRLLGKDGCLQVDMNGDTDDNTFPQQSLITVVDFLRDCKIDGKAWKILSQVAREKALGWDAESYGKKMLHIIDKYSIS